MASAAATRRRSVSSQVSSDSNSGIGDGLESGDSERPRKQRRRSATVKLLTRGGTGRTVILADDGASAKLPDYLQGEDQSDDEENDPNVIPPSSNSNADDDDDDDESSSGGSSSDAESGKPVPIGDTYQARVDARPVYDAAWQATEHKRNCIGSTLVFSADVLQSELKTLTPEERQMLGDTGTEKDGDATTSRLNKYIEHEQKTLMKRNGFQFNPFTLELIYQLFFHERGGNLATVSKKLWEKLNIDNGFSYIPLCELPNFSYDEYCDFTRCLYENHKNFLTMSRSSKLFQFNQSKRMKMSRAHLVWVYYIKYKQWKLQNGYLHCFNINNVNVNQTACITLPVSDGGGTGTDNAMSSTTPTAIVPNLNGDSNVGGNNNATGDQAVANGTTAAQQNGASATAGVTAGAAGLFVNTEISDVKLRLSPYRSVHMLHCLARSRPDGFTPDNRMSRVIHQLRVAKVTGNLNHIKGAALNSTTTGNNPTNTSIARVKR